MKRSIDFKALAEAALAQAEQLLGEWLPDGKRDGHEWKALNPTRGDSSLGSFSINIQTGAWSDFATGDKGGDLVSLYAYLFTHGKQLDAAKELAERLGIKMPPASSNPPSRITGNVENGTTPEENVVPTSKAKTPWRPISPVPDNAPGPPVAHLARGRPERTWSYRNDQGQLLCHVCRFRTSDGGKEILPLVWARNVDTGEEAWRWMALPQPRALYGLDRLAVKTERTVLVVEGEKCADAAHAALTEFAVVSWPGGAKAVDKADWSVLRGRDVVIWADCDAQTDKHGALLPESKQPGMMAAERIAQLLSGIARSVHIVAIPPPGAKPSGWDIADAVDEGLKGPDLAAWIMQHLRPPAAPGKATPPPTSAGAKGGTEWRDALLEKRGELVACLANIFDILTHSEVWKDVVFFDEFAQRTVKKKPPPYPRGAVGEWDSTDDTQTAMWLTRQFGLTPSSAQVAEAIEIFARANTFHPVRDWLRSLPPWDGIKRCESWVSDFLGAKNSRYTQLVGQWFPMGMIARVMQPGVKFDYCLVLEGPQGKRKSSALAVLGGEWFGDTDLDLHNKDSMSALRGHWLYEFPELGSITRAETMKQKSFLARQVDVFRPVYGRREIRCPRQIAFSGTTNEWGWNKDPTGGRRFWPIDCEGEIDLDGLRAVREQLFAEALAAYHAGERFWPTTEEQKTIFDPEQLSREQPEGLIDALHDWVYGRVAEFSIADAVLSGLNLDASKLTRDLQTRVGIALRKLGCEKVERRNGMMRYWYKPPQKSATSSDQPVRHDEDDDMIPPF